MALTDKLTSVASEIRNKTGLSDALTLDQMVIDIAASPSGVGNVPDYVVTEAERVAAAVGALQNDNTLSFIAMSDTHIGNGSYDVSITHAAQAARIISGRVPIDFIAHLGDAVTGAASDSLETHLGNHMNSLRAMSIAAPDLRLVGNHDANAYNADSYQSAEDTNKYIGRFTTKATKPDSEPERGYFYYDIPVKKTRVICLNSCDLKDLEVNSVSDGHYISAVQYQWLVSALDMSGKTGWRLIVLSHHPVHWYGYMPNVLTLLDAYVAGSSGSITAGGISISYNFNGKNDAKLVATFHGHTHNLIHGTVGNAEIIRMGTPNGCYTRSNEYGSTSYNEDFRSKYGETTTYSKSSGTAKDTAFCVYTIDFGEEIVYATCYGAGYDRTMSYGNGLVIMAQPTDIKAAAGDTVTFTVMATGVASYQWQVGGTDGANWTDLTWDGAKTASMTHAMNETNITYVYRCKLTGVDGTELYTNVIKFLPLYTNQIPISIASDSSVYNGTGYKEGYRLSTSSGNESGAAGMTVTGFIWVPSNATIRVKDIDLSSGNSTWGIYNSDFSFDVGGYCNSTFTAADANGVRTRVNTAGDKYYRISGAFGTNPIITVNEEIR